LAVSLLHSADRDLLLHDDGHDVVHVARQQLHTRTHCTSVPGFCT
jgi:hypothetical protein